MTKGNGVVALPFIPREKVRGEIARIAREDTAHLDVLDHAAMRMTERHVSMRQVLTVLKCGDLQGDITWCTDKEKGWRCRLSRVTAGINVTVVAKLVRRDEAVCLVITTWEG